MWTTLLCSYLFNSPKNKSSAGTTYYNGIPISRSYLDQKDYWDILMEIYQNLVLNPFHFLPLRHLLYHPSVHLSIWVPLLSMNGIFKTSLQEVILLLNVLMVQAWVWLQLGWPKMLGTRSKQSEEKVLICNAPMPRKLLIEQFILKERRSRSTLNYFELKERLWITSVHLWWIMRPGEEL